MGYCPCVSGLAITIPVTCRALPHSDKVLPGANHSTNTVISPCLPKCSQVAYRPKWTSNDAISVALFQLSHVPHRAVGVPDWEIKSRMNTITLN